MKKTTTIFLLLAALRATAQPTISAISPLSGIPGSTVTITGTGFNTTPANDVVYFGATRATVTSASATSLTVTVPEGATYSPVSVDNMATHLTAFSPLQFLPTYDNSGIVPGTIAFDTSQPIAYDGALLYTYRAVADIDGDGKTDIVVIRSNGSGSSSIAVYRNTSTPGSVSYAPPIIMPIGAVHYVVALADLDGDGKPDIAATNTGTPGVTVFQNTSVPGTISFGALVSFAIYPDGGAPWGIAIGDLDGDGKPDMVVTSITVQVYHNTSIAGTITSGSFATPVTFPESHYSTSVVISDLDGDGKPDITTTNDDDSMVSVYHNTCSTGVINTSSFEPVVSFPAGATPVYLSTGDIDGDGRPDILVSNGGDSTVSILRNTSSVGSIAAGSFAGPIAIQTGGPTEQAVLGDIDGDGKPDIAVASPGVSKISCLRNTASAGPITASSFAAPSIFTIGASGYTNYFLSLYDVDGDGKPDLVADDGYGDFSVLTNHPLPAVTTQVKLSLEPVDLKLIPNPNNGTFTLSGLTGSTKDEPIAIEISDMLGQVVYHNSALASGGVINVEVLLNNSLANGMYLLNVKSVDASKVLHFVIEK